MSNQTVKSLNDAIAAEAKARGWQVAIGHQRYVHGCREAEGL